MLNDQREKTSTSFSKENSPFFAPSISLPKGGGAIRGIGVKFAANPVTGTDSMSVSIAPKPGRSVFGPRLNLTHDSGADRGFFAFGLSLSLLSITRKTDKGWLRSRDVDNSDDLILSGAEDLILELKKVQNGNRIVEDGKHVISEEPHIMGAEHQLPFFVEGHSPTITSAKWVARLKKVSPNSNLNQDNNSVQFSSLNQKMPSFLPGGASANLDTSVALTTTALIDVQDLYLVLNYSLDP